MELKSGILSFFLILVLLGTNGCTRKFEGETLVFTEELVFVSGEILRVTGRVVAPGEVDLDDHGFEISQDESFANPIVISLGEQNIPGLFIAEYTGLSITTDYYVRAYIVNSGTTFYGENVQFITLEPFLRTASPLYHDPQGLVKIRGKNFTTDTRVFFGEVEAELISNKFESILDVRAPQPRENEYLVPIKVISGGKEMTFEDSFEYVIGRWTTESDEFPGSKSFGRHAYFVAEDKLYTGFQRDSNNPDQLSFWVYDPSVGNWDEQPFQGSFVRNPAKFDGGFLGGETGAAFGVYFMSNEFWVVRNGQFELEGILPFQSHRSVAFREGDDLYVFGGWGAEPNVYLDTVWKYNFGSREWIEFDRTPFDLYNLNPSFRHDGMMYFISSERILFRYDPTTKTWTEMGEYPGSLVTSGVAVVIGETAIVGQASSDRAIYEYNIEANTWKRKVPTPLTHPLDIALSVWVLDDRYFTLRSNGVGLRSPKLWEFEPFELY